MISVITCVAAVSVATGQIGGDAATASGNMTIVDFQPGFVSGSFESARDVAAGRLGAQGDTFDAAVTTFDNPVTTGAALNGPGSFTWSGPGVGAAQSFGPNAVTGAATNLVTFQQQSGASFLVQTNAFTTDSSDMLPAGVTFVSTGTTASILSMEVGGGNAGTDPINWDPAQPLTLVDFGVALFVDGSEVFSASALGTSGDLNSGNDLAGFVGVNNANGQGVDEIAMFWVFDKVPTPGATALFAMAGLAVARRRRA